MRHSQFFFAIQVEDKLFLRESSAPERGTTAASINRTSKTNAKQGAEVDFNAYKYFHERETEGHIIAAFMQFSGMKTMESKLC